MKGLEREGGERECECVNICVIQGEREGEREFVYVCDY